VPGANWALGWHQDSVIAVAGQRDVSGFLAWGQKAGVWQVQPPPEILAAMVAVRIHLDECGPENGPLRVIPGSHRHGWLDNEIGRWKREVEAVSCLASAGGAVVMCPLILHASSKAISPSHRRVIHIEYASEELPGGLEWHRRVGAADSD
jgi:ectoine hydroxylase-related dioxygenase (phytanoyl-CoA dioxygenase family)